MYSDAELYSEHRSMQIRDTNIFLESVVRKMDWSREEQDIVMDIGCGPGNSCRTMFLPVFPTVKKVIGVDVLPDMIEFAKKNNADQKIEYHVADIEDRSTIEKWSQQISKIISIYCFHWLGNQRDAFSNIYHLLKPGGEAALLFELTAPVWDSYELHYNNPKWSKYLQNINPHVPESHVKKYDASFYSSLLQDIGFNVVICEDEKRTFTYSSEEDCRVASYRSALTSYIPDELQSEFREDIFQGFLKYNGRNSVNGKPMLHYTTLTLLIQKPNV